MKKTLASVFAFAIMVSAFAGTVTEDKNKKADRTKIEAAKKNVDSKTARKVSPSVKKETTKKQTNN